MQAVIATRRSLTPAHPPKSAEKLALERGTWFDMYSGRAAILPFAVVRIEPQTFDKPLIVEANISLDARL